MPSFFMALRAEVLFLVLQLFTYKYDSIQLFGGGRLGTKMADAQFSN